MSTVPTPPHTQQEPWALFERVPGLLADFAAAKPDLEAELLVDSASLDPRRIVRNCTNLVGNYITGRLALRKFGKELPCRKAGSRNCTKWWEFGEELPYRKAGSTPTRSEAVRGHKKAYEGVGLHGGRNYRKAGSTRMR